MAKLQFLRKNVQILVKNFEFCQKRPNLRGNVTEIYVCTGICNFTEVSAQTIYRNLQFLQKSAIFIQESAIFYRKLQRNYRNLQFYRGILTNHLHKTTIIQKSAIFTGICNFYRNLQFLYRNLGGKFYRNL